MKNLFLTILLCSFCVCISCDKQDEVDISPDGLTQCESGYECLYTFTQNSRIDSNRVKPGNYTVFHTEKKNSYSSQNLYVELRSQDTRFNLGKKEIENGQVVSNFICPTCNYVITKPIDGFVKGKKVNDTTWLLEMQLMIAAEGSNKIADTLNLKQYFNLKNN